MSKPRKAYPLDVGWEFVAPYLALVGEDSPQRLHDLREAFNALRSIGTSGQWRFMPNDSPPREAVYFATYCLPPQVAEWETRMRNAVVLS